MTRAGVKIDGRGHIHRGTDERDRLLELYRKSGASKRGFCRQNGIATNTFYGWLRKSSKPIFARVDIREKESDKISGVEFELSGGIRARVGIRDYNQAARLIRLVNSGGMGC